jgi:hypothetical protein
MLLLVASCGKEEARSRMPESSSQSADISAHLRQPGKITHVRYTSVTPPWPTRTEAWIDWENDRMRSWNVQWTDSPTNPYVCTSIEDHDDWYPCLPSLEELTPEQSSRMRAFYPTVPLRVSDTQLSVQLPYAGLFGDGSALAPVELSPHGSTSAESQGDTDVTVTSWKIVSNLELPCEGGVTGEAGFEYKQSAQGEPISEFITVNCGTESASYFGVLYHEVEFLEPSDLPADFFDPASVRSSLVTEELSSAAAQLGKVFWFGDRSGDWALSSVEHDGDRAHLGYTRGHGDDQEFIVLSVRKGRIGRVCDGAEPLPDDAYGGSICGLGDPLAETLATWAVPGFDVWLEEESYPRQIDRDDVLALASSLAEWKQAASRALLSEDDVRNLVADSLELVCPSKLSEIREARADASFGFKRDSGEWTGQFGSLGKFAVPDAKPVAIPISQRETVESTLSHNAAQFAECITDEQPPAEEGDDEFAVEFLAEDDSGFLFEITGIDDGADAALTFCGLTDDAGCRLIDPSGKAIDLGPMEVNAIRAQVYRLHVNVYRDEFDRRGTWTFSVDLGDGHSAETAFKIGNGE